MNVSISAYILSIVHPTFYASILLITKVDKGQPPLCEGVLSPIVVGDIFSYVLRDDCVKAPVADIAHRVVHLLEAPEVGGLEELQFGYS